MAVSKKPTNPSSTLHPPYLQMIGEALSSLKERTGSSQPAIAKFIQHKYNNTLPPNFSKMLQTQLKKLVESEKLVKIRNSYKVSASEKVKKLVAVTVKESRKKTTDDVMRVNPKANASKKADKKKEEKMKRLSQVKTPEALKKNLAASKPVRSSRAATKKART